MCNIHIPDQTKALVLAPLGRDAVIVGKLLQEAGIASMACNSLVDLQHHLADDACFLILASEALRAADLRGLASWLSSQPSWSDLPVIILTQQASDAAEPATWRLPEILGNVTFVERPFHPATFVSIARTARAGRMRQYETKALIEKLRASEERFRAFVTTSSDVVYRMNADWSEMWHLEGQGFVSDTQTPDGNWLENYIHPVDQPRVLAGVKEAIANQTMFEMEHRVRDADGRLSWTVSRAVPIRDAAGRIVEWFGAASDITARKNAEAALRESEGQYRILFNSIDEGFCTIQVDFDRNNQPVDYRFMQVNPAFERQSGLTNAVGKRVSDAVPELEEDWYRTYGRIALNGVPERFELRAAALERWFDVFAFRIGEPTERRVAILFRDVSDRKRAEETQRLLLGELNHRVKNTLATVQSIVQMTLRHTKDPQAFAKAFAGRVQSLARVHSILTDSVWESADLRTVIRDQLLNGVVEAHRLTMSGADIRLPPQTALHAALMLHELGTNAVKYGALSVPGGTITIDWALQGRALLLRWTEKGGPPAKEPVRRGFGTSLIERTAKSDGGDARATFGERGVTWMIRLPLEKMPAAARRENSHTEGEADTLWSPQTAPHSNNGALQGHRVLVIEDEPLVAMDVVAQLESAGAVVVGSAGNVADALAIIETAQMESALLDANLNGDAVDLIADALSRRRIPFVFVTGYGRADLPKAYSTVPILGKPYNQDQLLTAVRSLFVVS